MTTQMMCYDEV